MSDNKEERTELLAGIMEIDRQMYNLRREITEKSLVIMDIKDEMMELQREVRDLTNTLMSLIVAGDRLWAEYFDEDVYFDEDDKSITQIFEGMEYQ